MGYGIKGSAIVDGTIGVQPVMDALAYVDTTWTTIVGFDDTSLLAPGTSNGMDDPGSDSNSAWYGVTVTFFPGTEFQFTKTISCNANVKVYKLDTGWVNVSTIAADDWIMTSYLNETWNDFFWQVTSVTQFSIASTMWWIVWNSGTPTKKQNFFANAIGVKTTS